MYRMLMPLCVVAFAALLTACGAPYVNVPPIPGDVAFHDPNANDVRAMEVKALRYLLQQYPPAGAYAVALPPGTTTDTHAFVIAQLPGDHAPTAEQTTLPTYRVAQIQGRTWSTRVDIIAPEPTGERLVSVFLGHDIDGWFPLHARRWNVPVDQALQLARPLADVSDDAKVTEPAPAPGNAPAPAEKPAEK